MAYRRFKGKGSVMSGRSGSNPGTTMISFSVMLVMLLVGILVANIIFGQMGSVFSGANGESAKGPFNSGLNLLGWTVNTATGNVTSTTLTSTGLIGILGLVAVVGLIIWGIRKFLR